MDDRLRDLYTIPENVVPQDIYLLDLSEQCTRLELQVRTVAQSLPAKQRQVIEAFLEARDELEYQSVKIPMQYGKHLK